MRTSIPVLIVGAGPTGLMLAALLTRLGIRCRVVDKAAQHTTQSRALVVQARSLEIFDRLGIADRAIAQGQKAKAVTIVVRGRRVMRMELGDVGTGLTRYPYLLMLEQSKTEALLEDVLGQAGGAEERQTELLDLAQTPTGVTATLRTADGRTEAVAAEWLVGADGVHSRVRQQLGIAFEGNTYDQSLFVLDCEMSLDLPRDEMMIVFSDGAFTGLFPLVNGRVRVLGTVPPGREAHEELTFAQVVDTFAARVGFPVSLSHPEWISVYRAHHRAVATFRQGRCFLAGDAAHVHSPVGAQGMNTGLQDAYNLAWKLAAVMQGRARDSLLDTYEGERRGIARSLVRTTDRAFFYVNSENRVLKMLRLRVLPVVLPLVWPLASRQPQLREQGFKTISQIGLHYRTSPLSEQAPGARFPRAAPRPGDRLPYTGSGQDAHPTVQNLQDFVDGTSLSVLLLPGDAAQASVQAFTEALRRAYPQITFHPMPRSDTSRFLYDRLGVSTCGYYLVRPDQYIAYRGTGLDPTPLLAYLDRYWIPAVRTP